MRMEWSLLYVLQKVLLDGFTHMAIMTAAFSVEMEEQQMYSELVVHKATLNVAHKGYVMIYIYTISFNQIQYTLGYPAGEDKGCMKNR
jgi:hypothetical protein